MNTAENISHIPTADYEDQAEWEAAFIADLQASALADLAHARAVAMRFIDRLDRRAAGEMTEAEEKSFPRAGDDCNAFARMARALRQIIALEFETVGLREQPQRRGYISANQNGPDRYGRRGESLRHGRERGAGYDLRDGDDYDDYEDDPRAAAAEAAEWRAAVINKVCDAIDIDLRAAGMEEEASRRPSRYKIRGPCMTIPHPALDKCVREMDPAYVAVLFGPDLFPQLGIGPPPEEAVEIWKKHGRKA
jgi:hypothetical protein